MAALWQIKGVPAEVTRKAEGETICTHLTCNENMTWISNEKI